MFVIEGIKLEHWTLFIYNRWGKEIFISENYINKWSAEGLDGRIYYYSLGNKKDNRTYKGLLNVYFKEYTRRIVASIGVYWLKNYNKTKTWKG
jgi:hypothetical protein